MDAKLYSFKAKELRNQKKYNEAIALLEEGITHYPLDVPLTNQLMQCYGTNNLKMAEKIFEAAISKRIADSYTYNILLNIYAKLKCHGSASEVFSKMPDELKNDVTYNTMLNLHAQVRDKQEALLLFMKMPNRFKDKITYSTMLNLYVKTDDFDEAVKFFNKIPNHLKSDIAYNTMLNLYYVQEEYDKGLEFFSAMPEKMKDTVSKTVEIEFHRKLKNYARCIEIIRDLLKRPESLSAEKIITLKTIEAYCVKDSGNSVEASKLFKELLKMVPEDHSSYIRIACGFVFCKNMSEREADLIGNVLMKAYREGKGREEDVSAALNILAGIGVFKPKIKVTHIIPGRGIKQQF